MLPCIPSINGRVIIVDHGSHHDLIGIGGVHANGWFTGDSITLGRADDDILMLFVTTNGEETGKQQG